MSCSVCLVRHQADIHAATLAVHKYLRRRVAAAVKAGAEAGVFRGPRGKKVLSPIEAVGRYPRKEQYVANKTARPYR